MINPALLLALPPIFLAADFISGRDYFKGKGRPYYYLGPLMALFFFFITPMLALLAPAWIVWRSLLPWKLFGGALNPKGKQVVGLLLRNLVGIIPSVALLIFLGVQWWIAAPAMAVFIVAATYLNTWLTTEAKKGKDVDPQVDALHGLIYGVLTALSLWSVFH